MASTKGERTRAAILDEALKIVSKSGLEGLTIAHMAAIYTYLKYAKARIMNPN